MSAAERARRVRHALEEMNHGNPGPFLALLAAEVTYTIIGDTRFSGTFRGQHAFLEQVATPLVSSLSTPLRLEVRNVIAAGDAVIVQAQGSASVRSGVPYNNTYCWVFRFAGAQAVTVTEYLDTALVERAFAVPVERESLLRSMDLNMWEMFREGDRRARAAQIAETRQFWMGCNPRGATFHNMLMVCDAVDVETLLAAARDFFVPHVPAFSVCVRDHADAAVETALRARGFTDLAVMPGMVLLAAPPERPSPAELEIRAVTDDAARRDFTAVTADAYAAYAAPRTLAEDAFAYLDSLCAPHIQGFVGYAAGEPAAAAAVYVTHGVAGIGWVGTRPAFRQRGFGEAVTWAAVREGFRRGARFANLQASPMGRPIYERMGFVAMTEYRVLAAPQVDPE